MFQEMMDVHPDGLRPLSLPSGDRPRGAAAGGRARPAAGLLGRRRQQPGAELRRGRGRRGCPARDGWPTARPRRTRPLSRPPARSSLRAASAKWAGTIPALAAAARSTRSAAALEPPARRQALDDAGARFGPGTGPGPGRPASMDRIVPAKGTFIQPRLYSPGRWLRRQRDRQRPLPSTESSWRCSARSSSGQGTIFDPDALTRDIAALEEAMRAPDFWDDQSHAQAVSTRYSRLRSRLEDFEHARLPGGRPGDTPRHGRRRGFRRRGARGAGGRDRTGGDRDRLGRWSTWRSSVSSRGSSTRATPSSASTPERGAPRARIGPRCSSACTCAGRRRGASPWS